jgi:hypothetical protein
MNYSNLLVGGLLALLVQVSANAQVYESEDAEGVPEFSDSPTPGAEVVDIPSTNLMDAPEAEAAPAPAAPPQSAPVAGGGDTEAGEGESVDYYGGDDEDNVRLQRREDADRIEHVIPGNGEAEAVRTEGAEAVRSEAGGRR